MRWRREQQRKFPDIVREREKLNSHNFHIAHPNFRRDQHLRLVYGVTQQEWEELFFRQGRRCAVCHSRTAGRKESEIGGNWHTDHNPKLKVGDQGFVRGILCHWCNTAANEHNTPMRLRALADYLEKHQCA